MDLEKFWLGNVDERGEIDKEQGYDDDEKDGLLRTTKNEGLTKGAVNDEDTRRDQDDEFAVDTVAKAQEAVDYSQEEEAVVDDAQAGSSDYYYKRGVSLLVGKQGASVSGLPVRKTDDDYDEEEDDGEGEEKALEQPPLGRHPQQGAATAEQREEEAASRKARLDQEAWEQQQALLKAKPPTERLRKGGMLLLSEMFVGPPVETRIARARISKTSHVLAAKVEAESDEEDHFVDEAAQRAAAAANMRARERADNAGVEEDSEEEDDEGGQEHDESPVLVHELSSGISQEEAVDEQKGAALESKGALDLSNKALQPVEAMMWESNIIWEDDDSDDDGWGAASASRGAKKAKRAHDTEEEEGDEDGEDEFVEEDTGTAPNGAGGEGGAQPADGLQWLEEDLGLGLGGGGDVSMEEAGVMLPEEGGIDDGLEIVPPPVEKDKEPSAASRVFKPRDPNHPVNEVRLGERNAELDNGDWLELVLWHEGQRKKVMSSRTLPNSRRLAVQRPHHTKLDVYLAPHSRSEAVHECLPAWRCRADFKPLPMSATISRLDLSNDKYYEQSVGTKARIKLGKPKVVNAAAATRFTRPSAAHYKGFHRIKAIRDQVAERIRFKPTPWPEKSKDKEKKGSQEKLSDIKHRRDVTMVDARTLLIEHYEEEPPLVLNTGMGCQLRHYYRTKPEGTPAPIIAQEYKADGKPEPLDPQQETPFYGELPDGQNDFVSSIETNLFRAPLAKHAPGTNDFLVIKQGNSYYLREIDSLYLAGQTHPFQKVPAPGSKDHSAYQRRHLLTFIHGRLKDGGTLKTYEIHDEFPEATDAAIRKQLKECADFSREGGEGGHWTLKDTFEMPKEVIEEKETPDLACVYDSLKVGQMMLKRMNISKLHLLDGVSNVVQEIHKEKNLDIDIKNGALAVQESLRNTPWNITANFVGALDGRAQLQLSSLCGSSTARKVASRDENNNDKTDPKGQDKKQQVDHNRKRQMAFNEMLETISQKERDSSGDEEDEDTEFYKAYEQEEDALFDGSRTPLGSRRMHKETIAHRWYQETNKQGELKWKCSTLRDPSEVADFIQRIERQKMTVEMGDERAKADVRREKKRIQEQQRRAKKKHGSSSMTMDYKPREQLQKIRISAGAHEAYKAAKKREVPDHLQGRSVKRQRRRLNPVMELNMVFEECTNAMWQHKKSLEFRNPVDSRCNPDYRRIIKKPIDLNIIRTRCQTHIYTSEESYLGDVNLMVNNCKDYCATRAPHVVSDVYELNEECQEALIANKKRIIEAESMIKLSKFFEGIITELAVNKNNMSFKTPVSAKDYSACIKTPMDLQTMKEKALAFSYASREGLLGDLTLIKANCYAYCEGRYPDLPPRAEQLLTDAYTLLEKNHKELQDLEPKVGKWAQVRSSMGTPGTSYPGTPGRATPARTPAMPSSPGNEPQAESGGTILEDDLGESILPELEDQLEMEPEDDSFPASQEMDADNLEDALEEQCVEGNGVGMDILGEGMNAPYGHVNEF